MKLGYGLSIYVGYYFGFSLRKTCISHPNESYQQSPEKMKDNGECKRQH